MLHFVSTKITETCPDIRQGWSDDYLYILDLTQTIVRERVYLSLHTVVLREEGSHGMAGDHSCRLEGACACERLLVWAYRDEHVTHRERAIDATPAVGGGV